MIFDALSYEIRQVYPDFPVFFVESENVDEYPPYVAINLVDGAPAGSGESGRWQIRVVHNDKFALEGEIIPALKKIFHDKGGMSGEPGREENFLMCGVVSEAPVLKGENEGVFYKSFDLKIFYR